MATYQAIQIFVLKKHGFSPKTCWIADVKEKSGLHPRRAVNRISEKRANPCPLNKIQAIKDALKFYKMI